jgi:hypothetical protein
MRSNQERTDRAGACATDIADDICEQLRPIRNRCDELAAFATKDHSGSGGWWELSGYAEILDDAMKRIRSHRVRVEGVDRQIARERGSGNQASTGTSGSLRSEAQD